MHRNPTDNTAGVRFSRRMCPLLGFPLLFRVVAAFLCARLQLPFEAVENITKPLASVSKMVDAGQAVLYHPSGSAIYDLSDSRNKELKIILGGVAMNNGYSKIPLKRENDVYNFELLVDMPASQEANRPATGPGFGRPR